MRISGILCSIAAAAAVCLASGCTMNSVLGSVKPDMSLPELAASGSGSLGDIRCVSTRSYPSVRDPAFDFGSSLERGSVEDFSLLSYNDMYSVYYYSTLNREGSDGSDDTMGHYAIDLYRHNSGERITLLERGNIAESSSVNFCSVMMSSQDSDINCIACVDNEFYYISASADKQPSCVEAAMSSSLANYIKKYVGSTEFICLDMAKMSDHVAAVFMNNDESSDDYQKTSVIVLEFDFTKDKPEKRITDWEEYYVNESDDLTFDPAQFGNYITSSTDADTGDVIFLRNSGQRVDETEDKYGFYTTKQENLSYIEFGYISTRGLQGYDESHAGGAFEARNFIISKGRKKVARKDSSLTAEEKASATDRRLVTFTLLCNKEELDDASGKPIQYLMLIFNDAIEMWKLEESENWIGNVKLTPKFQFYVPFDDGESLKMADGLNQVVYSFEDSRLYTATMLSGVREYTIEDKVGELTDTITENAAFLLGENYYIGFPDTEVLTVRKKYISGEALPRETTESMEDYDMSDLPYAGRYRHGKMLKIFN